MLSCTSPSFASQYIPLPSWSRTEQTSLLHSTSLLSSGFDSLKTLELSTEYPSTTAIFLPTTPSAGGLVRTGVRPNTSTLERGAIHFGGRSCPCTRGSS